MKVSFLFFSDVIDMNLLLSNSSAIIFGFNFKIVDSTSLILCIAMWDVPIIVRFL